MEQIIKEKIALLMRKEDLEEKKIKLELEMKKIELSEKNIELALKRLERKLAAKEEVSNEEKLPDMTQEEAAFFVSKLKAFCRNSAAHKKDGVSYNDLVSGVGKEVVDKMVSWNFIGCNNGLDKPAFIAWHINKIHPFEKRTIDNLSQFAEGVIPLTKLVS